MVYYVAHLCPITISVRASAAQLERQVCRFILNALIKPHATVRARAMARLLPIHIRRQAIAFNRSYAARQANHDYRRGSLQLHHRRGSTLLSSNILHEPRIGNPRPPLENMAELRRFIDTLHAKEWSRANQEARSLLIMSYFLGLSNSFQDCILKTMLYNCMNDCTTR